MKINVSVIIVHDHKALLIQRSLADDYRPGDWGIPGGYLEDGDGSLEDTAIREVFEETGLRIIPKEIIFNNTNHATDSLYLVYSAELDVSKTGPEELTSSDEINDIRWVVKKEVGELKLTPHTRDRLIKVLSSL
jgi:8-oxo-dGTP pyrophosphatase MutT (NUDIX family)